MRKLASTVIVATTLAITGCDSRKPRMEPIQLKSRNQTRMITLQQIEVMFNEMLADNKWDVDGPLVWGYFFTDHNRERLLAAASALERMNYRVVGILEPSQDNEDRKLMFLHAEKIERHTPHTLDSRNIELYRFAEQFGL